MGKKRKWYQKIGRAAQSIVKKATPFLPLISMIIPPLATVARAAGIAGAVMQKRKETAEAVNNDEISVLDAQSLQEESYGTTESITGFRGPSGPGISEEVDEDEEETSPEISIDEEY